MTWRLIHPFLSFFPFLDIIFHHHQNELLSFSDGHHAKNWNEKKTNVAGTSFAGHVLSLIKTLIELDKKYNLYEPKKRNVRYEKIHCIQRGTRTDKLMNSTGRDLRRALFSLKQMFQDDKSLVHEFVQNDGLACLIKVGSEADQNYQNYILRGEKILPVDRLFHHHHHYSSFPFLSFPSLTLSSSFHSFLSYSFLSHSSLRNKWKEMKEYWMQWIGFVTMSGSLPLILTFQKELLLCYIQGSIHSSSRSLSYFSLLFLTLISPSHPFSLTFIPSYFMSFSLILTIHVVYPFHFPFQHNNSAVATTTKPSLTGHEPDEPKKKRTALGQVMLYVDGMEGVIEHNETIQWLYSLISVKVSNLSLDFFFLSLSLFFSLWQLSPSFILSSTPLKPFLLSVLFSLWKYIKNGLFGKK